MNIRQAITCVTEGKMTASEAYGAMDGTGKGKGKPGGGRRNKNTKPCPDEGPGYGKGGGRGKGKNRKKKKTTTPPEDEPEETTQPLNLGNLTVVNWKEFAKGVTKKKRK